MPKHRKPTTPEAEIAAQFGAELKEFCRSQEVPVKRLAELTTYSQQYIYKILGTELPRRDLMEDIVTAVCDLHNYRPESKQETLDRWRVKWDTTYARLKEARASFESRLTVLNDGHESLQSQLDDLRQRIERLESEPRQPFEPRQERTLDLGRHRAPAR
ncbi:hypothetical protein G5C60_37300, partial [Streptomyces sp. HC44]